MGMTTNEAIEILRKNRPTSDPRPCGMELCDAVDMAISALRQQETVTNRNGLNEPLTLDDLRKLPIRDWVWIEILNPDAFRSKETVSAYYRKYDGYKKDEIFWCGYPGLGFRFFYEDYGKTWLAYRQKPEEDKHENLD